MVAVVQPAGDLLEPNPHVQAIDQGTTTFTHEDDDSRYVLTFRWFTVTFRDFFAVADVDGGGAQALSG